MKKFLARSCELPNLTWSNEETYRSLISTAALRSSLTRVMGLKNKETNKNIVIPAKAGIQESQETNLIT